MRQQNTYDTIIIGAGPAGVAAGVYVARKKLKTLLITQSFGGQSVVSASIENWIGEIKLSGFELREKLEKHLRAQEGIEIKSPEKVVSVKKQNGSFVVASDKKSYKTKTVIVASGGRRRRLGVPGEDKFEGKGVVYCSTCDAPFFRNKDVVVVGAGNSGLGAVIDLLPYANKIYLTDVLPEVKADQILQEKINKLDKVNILLETQVQEIYGDQFVSGVKYKDLKSGEVKDLVVQGVFVEIGSMPNSEFVKDLVKTDRRGQIVIDPRTQTTSEPGVFAAGDVTDLPYKQNNISAGDGAKAALSMYDFLIKQKSNK